MENRYNPRTQRKGKRFLPSCEDMSELAHDLLDRKLPLRDWIGARLHLGQCRACRNYVDQLRKTVGLLRGRGLAESPAEDADRAAAAAREAAPGKPVD